MKRPLKEHVVVVLGGGAGVNIRKPVSNNIKLFAVFDAIACCSNAYACILAASV
jgi:hypothetical protein